MKKVIFVVTFVLILALGLGVYYYRVRVAKLPIETILPEGAVFYVHISEIENSLEEFKSSRLWWNIKDIDVELLLAKSGLTQDELSQYRNFTSGFFLFTAELFLDKFFGQELALAVYPSRITTFDSDAMLDAAANIILVTRLKPEADFIELISKICNKFGRGVQIEYEDYSGHKISIVELTDKVNIAYVKIKDLLVIGLGKQAASNCLDVLAGAEPALARNKGYLSIVSRLPRPAQTVGYANLELLFSELQTLFEMMPESQERAFEQKAKILEAFNKTAGLKTAGYASRSGKMSKNKAILLFDKARMVPAVARGYSLQPQKNSTINFVPKDIIGYQWNLNDPKLGWENFQQELSQAPARLAQGPGPEDIIAGIESKSGMSIEYDIIPALGNEAGGFLADINLEGPFPLPEITFFVEIKDRAVIERAISTLTETGSVRLQAEQYQDVEIKYISLPFGRSLQPGYCFLGDYLLISTRSELLKESIDTLSDKSLSLLTDKDFQAVNFGLTEKNNSVFFLKTDLLLTKVRGICEWGLSWISLMSGSLQAYQREIQQQLDSIKMNIQLREVDLKNLEADFQSVEKEIADLQYQGLDASIRQQERAGLEAKIAEHKEKITLARKQLEEKEQEFSQAMQKSPLANVDVEVVGLYLDEVIYPVLDGLQEQKAMGSRVIFSENMLEAESFFISQK